MAPTETLNHIDFELPDDKFWAAVHEDLAPQAGLTRAETATFHELCLRQSAYPTYRELRAEAEELKHEPGVTVRPIGRSQDSPNDPDDPGYRPIALTITGDPEGTLAYLEGPQHGHERNGPATARAIKWLAILHPGFYRRMGYDGVAVSDHHDPDSMLLQQSPDTGFELHHATGGYRGAVEDQYCWNFPTSNSRAIPAETAATLRVIRQYRLGLLAALHGAPLTGQVLTSRVGSGEAELYPRLLNALGMLVDPLPDNATAIPLAPGVTPTENAAAYTAFVGTQPLEAGGTTVCDHLPPEVKYLNPDFPYLSLDIRSENPLIGQTLIDVLQERIVTCLDLISGMGLYIAQLQPWLEEHADEPVVGRLSRAVTWWHVGVPGGYRNTLALLYERYKNDRTQLRQSERDITVPYAPFNTAMYLGNLARLAAMAGEWQIESAALAGADRALALFGPTRPLPIPRQVAAQGLATLIGMRYARE